MARDQTPDIESGGRHTSAALPLALWGSWGTAGVGWVVGSRINMQNVLGGKESHFPQNLVIGTATITNLSTLQDSNTSDPTLREGTVDCGAFPRPTPTPRPDVFTSRGCEFTLCWETAPSLKPRAGDCTLLAQTACCSVDGRTECFYQRCGLEAGFLFLSPGGMRSTWEEGRRRGFSNEHAVESKVKRRSQKEQPIKLRACLQRGKVSGTANAQALLLLFPTNRSELCRPLPATPGRGGGWGLLQKWSKGNEMALCAAVTTWPPFGAIFGVAF